MYRSPVRRSSFLFHSHQAATEDFVKQKTCFCKSVILVTRRPSLQPVFLQEAQDAASIIPSKQAEIP